MSTLPRTFLTYLKLQNFSPVTCRNYLADINHFLGWLQFKVRSLNLPLPQDETKLVSFYFKKEFILEYKKFLLANACPPKTVNRRLSTLRTFGKFCVLQLWIKENPAKEITNVTPNQSAEHKDQNQKILEEFIEYLKMEKNSANTIKNYLSDIKAFFNFLGVTT